VIDGYDEAPSCSSFASGSSDIDVIFHVHCTKPVWCVTPRAHDLDISASLIARQSDGLVDEE